MIQPLRFPLNRIGQVIDLSFFDRDRDTAVTVRSNGAQQVNQLIHCVIGQAKGFSDSIQNNAFFLVIHPSHLNQNLDPQPIFQPAFDVRFEPRLPHTVCNADHEGSFLQAERFHGDHPGVEIRPGKFPFQLGQGLVPALNQVIRDVNFKRHHLNARVCQIQHNETRRTLKQIKNDD